MILFAETVIGPQRHKALHDQVPRSGNRFEPHASVACPVFDNFDRQERTHVGDIIGIFTPESFLMNLLPEGVPGVFVVVENTCDQQYTYELNGNVVRYTTRPTM